jgi:acyl-CoA thioesterase
VTHVFETDTALTGAGDGPRRAAVPEHWFVESGPNGGFLAALATRALIEAAGAEDRAPRSLTLQFLAPPQAGELEVAVAVERAGSSTTFASLRILQGGETVALGLGCCAAWREGQPEWDELERPPAPPPGELAPLTHIDGAPRFLENYEMRPWPKPPGPATTGGWIRTTKPRSADPILLAALTDAWVPAAFLRMEQPSFVPTLDLTIHWRAPLDAAPGEHPWVLALFSTRFAAGGTWEEDGELWSEDGVLLAQSRQLAIVRRART